MHVQDFVLFQIEWILRKYPKTLRSLVFQVGSLETHLLKREDVKKMK